MSLNSCSFTGRLGSDCETRYTGSGTPITNFDIAVDVGWGDRKHSIWIKCGIWGERGERVAPYLLKGTQVAVTGELDVREYAKRDGSGKGLSVELNECKVELLGSKEDRPVQQVTSKQQPTSGFRLSSNEGADKPAPPAASPRAQPAASVADIEDDDIPF